MSIFDRALHIPAEAAFLAPARGFERVLLPLQARPSWRLAVVAAVAFLIMFACVFLGGAFALSPTASIGGLIFKYGAATIFGAFAIVPAGVVVTALRDLSRDRAGLSVDSEGLRDARVGGTLLNWSEIACAELVSSGPGPCAIRLTLRQDGVPFYNPFRAGGWCARWQGRHRERVIALLLLDRRPHVIAQTILTLAARNGVEVDQPGPFVTVGGARSPWL